MSIPKELRYTKTHEWVRREGVAGVVGVTDHAQHEISDIVFVELPKVGAEAKKENPICVVESVKAAFDIYAPVSGTVSEVNEAVAADPSLPNKDPYGNGWLFKLKLSNPSETGELLDAAQYEAFIAEAKA